MDLLQLQIYFLTFLESLKMIFFNYKEHCEVLLDYPKIGGYNIKEFAKSPLGIFPVERAHNFIGIDASYVKIRVIGKRIR